VTKRNRNRVVWITVTLLTAAFIHYGVILSYPYVIMSALQARLVKHNGKNAMRHSPRPTSEDRIVVAPSPDLIYSVAAFDVSEAPLRITAPLTGSYMSVSLYADNTDNFFVQNDLQVDGDHFDLVLVGPGASDTSSGEARLIRSPSNTGIVLFRYFAGEGTHLEAIESQRPQIALTSLQ
jgi:uncharacterized membrane protein